MTELAFKISRTIMAAVLLVLFGGIYYRLGLIGDEDLVWQLWVTLGLVLIAGWLIIWRMAPRRRLLTVILSIVLCAIAFYAVDRLHTLWIIMWIPIMQGAGILAIACALAFFPSHGRDAA